MGAAPVRAAGGWQADRLLVDLGVDGKVMISLWREGEQAEALAGGPLSLVWPLDGDALEDLRWYLEDYLRCPMLFTRTGASRSRPKFRSGVGRYLCGVRLRPRSGCLLGLCGQRDVEIVYPVERTGMAGAAVGANVDPSRPAPLALDGAGISRMLPVGGRGGGGHLRWLVTSFGC